ncbi:MAG TPA: 4-carboxymuconolactone decarboxylase [Pseudonocardia sp.]|jgi:4-carboxymuconolactone decarboxylase|uniref:4-carboxymuconolactone decarboxylase n=1 Tax=Pseudonocardia sp. TaxID=60912 RepID=UPI002B4AC36C|nr:4-carboxymuconolactone decarboxylase [Pseudonocardia sp.]HLU56143.1 4-carboxymuconolactone decarboxylase [Pseudonocardia sp.]
MSEGNGAVQATDERYLQGLANRKQVLGEAHVERSLAAVSDFSRPVQEFVTRACWGDIWGRPGLDRRTRSLLNLVMLTALGRNHELGVHVRGAITNGATQEEIQEALLQSAIYCGVPAALESFRVAERVLAELAAEADDA